MQFSAETGGDDALSVVKGLVDAGGGGEVVQQSLKRHYEHLENLAGSLRKLGMDEHEIDENIMLVFREYERELVNYVNRILRSGFDRAHLRARSDRELNMSSCHVDLEDKRLAALYEYDVLDTPPEESFDRITRLVKITMNTPIAVVSLVDRDRQWFKSRQGTESVETARDISFCTHTIQKDEPLVVPNALADPRFAESPLVTCENGVRLYVGVPLKTPSGFNIGALCAIDTKPGQISPAQLNVMQDLARLVVDELELRKLASIDSLTGTMTGRSFTLEANKVLARARRYDRDLGCIMFDLDHFKKVNDTFGHAGGDQVLRIVAAICMGELRAGDILGRVGGEEFAMILPETSLAAALEVAERLRAKFTAAPVLYAGSEINVTASFGATVLSGIDANVETMMKRADAALYEAKNGGRNRVVSADPGFQAHEIAAVA